MRPYRTAVAGQMREKLTTLPARALYGRRKQIVEPVIGQIKAGRGFRGRAALPHAWVSIISARARPFVSKNSLIEPFISENKRAVIILGFDH